MCLIGWYVVRCDQPWESITIAGYVQEKRLIFIDLLEQCMLVNAVALPYRHVVFTNNKMDNGIFWQVAVIWNPLLLDWASGCHLCIDKHCLISPSHVLSHAEGLE